VRSTRRAAGYLARWVAVAGTDRTAPGDRNGLGIGLEAALEPLPAVMDWIPVVVVE
jgi:hypothetical protein